MRRTFSDYLEQKMTENPNIWLLTGDLGFKQFDNLFEKFPERVINCGASEQAMMGIAIGLSYEGKIPFVYSITPFLLYRPFETIRNYLSHERANVKLVGGGRDKDYLHDGFSHWSEEYMDVLDILKIPALNPVVKEDVLPMTDEMINNSGPYFLSLRR